MLPTYYQPVDEENFDGIITVAAAGVFQWAAETARKHRERKLDRKKQLREEHIRMWQKIHAHAAGDGTTFKTEDC